MPRCLIGLGSNQGNRQEALDTAVAHLAKHPQINVVARSAWRETTPMGGPKGQEKFLNGAVQLETTLGPHELLACLHRIESQLDRQRDERWGPRTIDLDLLLYDDLVLNAPDLTLPHPRLAFRRFALEPSAEVAGEMLHPTIGRTIAELLSHFDAKTRHEGNMDNRVLTPVVAVAELRDKIFAARRAGKKIGFVPTMGALHEGHLSLVRTAKAECDCAMVSIYVNPSQFDPNEDLAKYPRTLDADLKLLANCGADMVFVPTNDEVYRAGHSTWVEVGAVAEPLEGVLRPGHFRGVATIVLKLLNMVQPDVAYFGQKDYQQALVIRRMAADLDLPTAIRVCPIVREPDGLAMSSRNRYLSGTARQRALVLWQSLQLAVKLVDDGERDARVIATRMRELIEKAEDAQIDYVALVDPETLGPVETLSDRTLAALAVKIENTRLIDNCLLVVSG